jgi:phage anti-repressor protein
MKTTKSLKALKQKAEQSTDLLPAVAQNPAGVGVVSARELYAKLGGSDRNFARWSKTNIVKNDHLKHGEDWNAEKIKVGKTIVTDYILTVSAMFAVCMTHRTKLGHEARKYFIECEKQANGLFSVGNYKQPKF